MLFKRKKVRVVQILLTSNQSVKVRTRPNFVKQNIKCRRNEKKLLVILNKISKLNSKLINEIKPRNLVTLKKIVLLLSSVLLLLLLLLLSWLVFRDIGWIIENSFQEGWINATFGRTIIFLVELWRQVNFDWIITFLIPRTDWINKALLLNSGLKDCHISLVKVFEN